MANAIKKISVARGYDVTQYTLVTFGGAGGQHACAVADALGISRIMIHPMAGVLSAYGIGLAEIRTLKESSIERLLAESELLAVEQRFEELETEALEELSKQDAVPEQILRSVYLKYQGTNTALGVQSFDSTSNRESMTIPAMIEQFQLAYRKRFGFTMDPVERGIVIDSISIEAIAAAKNSVDRPFAPDPLGSSGQTRLENGESAIGEIGRTTLFLSDAWRSVSIFDRSRFRVGDGVAGPAIIVESTTLTVVDPGWSAEMTNSRDLLLTKSRTAPKPRTHRDAQNIGNAALTPLMPVADPVMLEVFNNLFMSIAEQMGAVLENAAYSVNIKERLDFSCALFDTGGKLIANAPHVPVHLGSMGEAVRAIVAERVGTVRPGDVYAANDPFTGGTHLPDITVITPVFGASTKSDPPANSPLFWVASRGHHADVGGLTPGSMPPQSRTIEDEGVLIRNFHLVEKGEFREEAFTSLLRNAPYPARNIAQNLGDIRAQIAANEKGVAELRRMVNEFGLNLVRTYMQHVRSNAAEQVRNAIDRLRSGRFVQKMDSGAEIHVSIEVIGSERRAIIDFSGTSPQLSDNFNAPSSIVRAAVLYVFRTLIKEDIPLNDGCLDALEIVIPEGSMLAPKMPAAVVAGNVETSQAITNALYGALGILAAGQGTMNNLTFGNERYQYYETICGGAGAGPGFGGASAVQTHMTNTRLTDPEVLELRYPVLLEAFEIRHGSGGAGRWSGGDGVIRRIRFREPMNVAILANHRIYPPFGIGGGRSGKVGRTYLIRRSGEIEYLGSSDHARMNAGDQIVIETPGGGGFGAV
jgi:5-oxoprolinase (ATP-hydrolysing)